MPFYNKRGDKPQGGQNPSNPTSAIKWGVLLACVPMLFGGCSERVSKSMASEIGPAAGAWIKMQQAYILEKESIGDCSQIGYNLPGNGKTTHFEYGCGILQGIAVLEARNNQNLGDCKAGSIWGVYMDSNGEIKAKQPDDKNCTKLIPDFCEFATDKKCGF